MLCPAIRLMPTGASHYMECGSLLPLSAAGAWPGVLLASTWERAISRLALLVYVARPAQRFRNDRSLPNPSSVQLACMRLIHSLECEIGGAYGSAP